VLFFFFFLEVWQLIKPHGYHTILEILIFVTNVVIRQMAMGSWENGRGFWIPVLMRMLVLPMFVGFFVLLFLRCRMAVVAADQQT